MSKKEDDILFELSDEDLNNFVDEPRPKDANAEDVFAPAPDDADLGMDINLDDLYADGIEDPSADDMAMDDPVEEALPDPIEEEALDDSTIDDALAEYDAYSEEESDDMAMDDPVEESLDDVLPSLEALDDDPLVEEEDMLPEELSADEEEDVLSEALPSDDELAEDFPLPAQNNTPARKVADDEIQKNVQDEAPLVKNTKTLDDEEPIQAEEVVREEAPPVEEPIPAPAPVKAAPAPVYDDEEEEKPKPKKKPMPIDEDEDEEEKAPKPKKKKAPAAVVKPVEPDYDQRYLKKEKEGFAGTFLLSEGEKVLSIYRALKGRGVGGRVYLTNRRFLMEGSLHTELPIEKVTGISTGKSTEVRGVKMLIGILLMIVCAAAVLAVTLQINADLTKILEDMSWIKYVAYSVGGVCGFIGIILFLTSIKRNFLLSVYTEGVQQAMSVRSNVRKNDVNIFQPIAYGKPGRDYRAFASQVGVRLMQIKKSLGK